MGSRPVRDLIIKCGGLQSSSKGIVSFLGARTPQMAKNRVNLCRTVFTGAGQSSKYLQQSAEAANASASSKTQVHSSQNRMEKTVNHVTLMGRVGGDPQKRGTQEHPVIVFSLATHSNYNYQTGGILQKTDWHRVCVFKPYLRDTVYKYMNKGQRVYITGRLSYGEIKDESGNAHTTTSIIADDVIFISNSPNQPPPNAEVD